MDDRENKAIAGGALGVLPTALTVGYLIIGAHGVLTLLGMDWVLLGPSLTPTQCLSILGLFVIRRIIRK